VLLIRNIEVVIFAAIERASGAWPMCQSPVPAESTVNLVAGSFDAKIPSAKVIYRYFPNKPLKFYRHNVFRALIFMNIFDKFLNCLSVATRLSTVLQACSTVAWSRSPIWEPMFAKEAFVNFLAKNMANCRACTTCLF
jgi:hypothetical protein